MHMAFARDACPVPFKGVRAAPALARHSALTRAAQNALSRGAAALQLFAGEMGLRNGLGRGYRYSTLQQDTAREKLVEAVAVGPRGGGVAEERRAQVKLLVEARQRSELWEESFLDKLCDRCVWADAAVTTAS